MNRLALITGGQQGIGLGIAKSLVEQGWHIAVASLPNSNDESVRQALQELGGQAEYYPYDLSCLSEIEPLLDDIESRQGRLTSLINNAGVTARVRGDMLDIKPDDFDFTLDINLKGTFFLSQAVARRLLTDHPMKRSIAPLYL